MKVIADVGNSEYYQTRAIEELTGDSGSLRMAIGLLALAIADIESKFEEPCI